MSCLLLKDLRDPEANVWGEREKRLTWLTDWLINRLIWLHMCFQHDSQVFIYIFYECNLNRSLESRLSITNSQIVFCCFGQERESANDLLAREPTTERSSRLAVLFGLKFFRHSKGFRWVTRFDHNHKSISKNCWNTVAFKTFECLTSFIQVSSIMIA